MQAHARPPAQNNGDLIMSIFSFFSRKSSSHPSVAPDSSGLGQGDATQPVIPDSDSTLKSVTPKDTNIDRQSERHGQRELLYSVVRDSMTRTGILAASYKFKVLSLDTRGRQYVIMIDLMTGSAYEAARLAEIEAMLAQSAKLRHDILVTAVYWRISEQVTVGRSSLTNQRPTPIKPESLAPVKPRLAAVQPEYEPLQDDEIASFKRAIATATVAVEKPAMGKVVTSGRRSLKPTNEFEDTLIGPVPERSSPLSVTQYGDLN